MHVQVAQAPGAQAPGKTETVSDPSNRNNYFVRHWRGEISLPISFWLNGICGIFVFGLLVKIITVGVRHAGPDPIIIAVALASFVIARFAFSIWQGVGIWRSATNHIMRTGRQFWARAAKLICIIVFMLFCYADVSFTIPAFKSIIDMLKGDLAFGPHVFRVLPNGTEMEFTGPITWRIADELKKVLDENPRIRAIHLNSPGGRLGEAEKMRDLIHQRGLTTYTSATCMSACTIAFLGGHERWIGEGARLGFHQGNIPGSAYRIFNRQINTGVADAYRSAGINKVFIEQAMAIPPSDIWFPTPTQLVYARVINGVAASGKFTPSGFFMNFAMKKALPYASGPMLDTFVKSFIVTIEAMEQVDQEACQRYFEHPFANSVDLAKYMSADLQARTLEVTKQIVRAKDFADPDDDKPAPTTAIVQPIYSLLEAALSKRGIDPASVKSVMNDQSHNRQRICWA